MKKILLCLIIGSSQLMLAQQLISFEASEGYTTGNIDTQQGWTTTSTGTSNITGQTVSTEQFMGGTRSLKITKEAAYGGQTNAVIGAFKQLSAPIPYNDFTISFDIKITDKSALASAYEFQTIGDGPTGRSYVVRLRFVENGTILAAQTTGSSSSWATTTGTWDANTWYRVKIVGTSTGISYYLNDVQIYTGNFFTQYSFDELSFVHDNYLGSGYIDRIAINNESGLLATNDVTNIRNRFSIFPNPTSDILNIKTDSKINAVSVVDMAGKKINVKLNGNQVDVKSLPAGNYMISVETKDGISTEKFIKK